VIHFFVLVVEVRFERMNGVLLITILAGVKETSQKLVDGVMNTIVAVDFFLVGFTRGFVKSDFVLLFVVLGMLNKDLCR
jgi:hypothetical protein